MWGEGLPLEKSLLTSVLLLTILILGAEGYYRCDGTPDINMVPPSPVNNRFMLKISGNPSMYVPGEKYAVGIQSARVNNVPEKFVGFALNIEPSAGYESSGEEKPNVGSFQLFGDALTKFSEKCPHMIMQASSAPRSEVNVHWTAPPPGSGCLTFRATVIVNKDLWYMHDGPLSRVLCEDIQENMDEQPDVMDTCCACDEAKYEVTFEGLWSRHTHPKDFPPNGWLTRFSDVIGASHTVDYRFWEYNGMASEGLKEVAERGWTRMLESELKAESDKIRTIIKARGISYPNVTGKTFAVFRVDKRHHLMSLVSMIVPSPDWIVGVSGLELCLRNCSWVEFKVLNLKPWDVGTDGGVTYTSPDSPLSPQEPIRRISSKYPADPSSPFYDPTGEELKPLARLYITRQRLYEKSCSDDSIGSDEEESNQDCAVGEWSDWMPCTASCGRGHRYKQRSYLNPAKALAAGCARDLHIKEECVSPIRCRYDQNENGNLMPTDPLLNEPTCAVTDWDEWGPCSATCGSAVKTRSRRYRLRGGLKRCGGLVGAPDLQETIPCELEKCEGEEEEEDENCPVNWSDWTPCSVSCGTGVKSRSSLSYPPPNPGCPTYRKTQTVECEGLFGSCNLSPESATELISTTDGYDFRGIQTGNQVIDNVPEGSNENEVPSVGGVVDCKVSRWSRWTPCSVTCGEGVRTKTRKIKVHPQNGGQPCPHRLIRTKPCNRGDCDGGGGDGQGTSWDSEEVNPTWGEPEAPGTGPSSGDCVMGRWSPWFPCSATCGLSASQMRTRSILSPPTLNGKPCEERVQTRSCNLLPCKV